MKTQRIVFQFTLVIIGAILFSLSPSLAQTITQINLDSSNDKDSRNIVNTEEYFPYTNKQKDYPTTDIDDYFQKYSQGQIDLNKITGVNQLQDISPEDWAYQALRSTF